MEIRTGNDDIVIIDAGTGIRRLGNSLLSQNRHQYAMLFTHAHWDHLMGFPFFKPIYVKGTSVSIFGCPFAQTSIKHMISRIMAPPNFPVDFNKIETAINYHESCDTLFALNSLNVTSIALSHPNQGMGYKFSEGDRCFVFLTDNELAHKHLGGLDYSNYVDFAYGADLLIHDAEYTEKDYQKTKTWGHSTYMHALQLAIDAKVKMLGLFHHNQERSDTAVDGIVEECRKIIGEQQASLKCFAVHQDMELVL
jgi:ribonuclease BN (tRNA processing enzyme)